jgi:hypothetical protein
MGTSILAQIKNTTMNFCASLISLNYLAVKYGSSLDLEIQGNIPPKRVVQAGNRANIKDGYQRITDNTSGQVTDPIPI